MVTFVVAGVLLVSMGAAILAAPVTLPLMWVAAVRNPTPAFRVAAKVLSALTVAEVVWALAYLTIDESQPWIWLLPGLAGLLAVTAAGRRPPASRAAGHP